MKAQEQFLPLENYKSEWNKTNKLEIYPEEAKAQIIEVFDANPQNIKDGYEEIEPLDSSEM